MFNYSIANCTPNSILNTVDNLSSLLADKSINVRPSTLLERLLIADGLNVDCKNAYADLENAEYQETSISLYGQLTRNDLNCNDLDYEYLKKLCASMAKQLKSHGVCKITGSELLSDVAKACGWKNIHVLKAKKAHITPSFQLIQFDEHGQDFDEFILVDGKIVDCQPYQGFVWIGKRAFVDHETNKLVITSTKDIDHNSYDFDSIVSDMRLMNYGLTHSNAVPLAYQRGYNDRMNEEDRKDNGDTNYQDGFNVASYNLRNA